MIKTPSLQNTFVLQLFTSCIMLAIAIVSQFINYPIYKILTDTQLIDYQSVYILKTLFLYGPIMLVEMLTAIRLTRKIHNHELHAKLRSNITILAIIWGITLFFELPAHVSLALSGFSSIAYRTILYGNLTRLVLWGLKCRILIRISPYMFQGEEIFDREFI